MFRVNQGFFGVISQSAKTSRGSRLGDKWILVPSGKTASSGGLMIGGAGGAGGAAPGFGLAALLLGGSLVLSSLLAAVSAD